MTDKFLSLFYQILPGGKWFLCNGDTMLLIVFIMDIILIALYHFEKSTVKQSITKAWRHSFIFITTGTLVLLVCTVFSISFFYLQGSSPPVSYEKHPAEQGSYYTYTYEDEDGVISHEPFYRDFEDGSGNLALFLTEKQQKKILLASTITMLLTGFYFFIFLLGFICRLLRRNRFY